MSTLRTTSCVPPSGLYKRSEVVTVPASGSASAEFTIQKGRGDIEALSLVCATTGSLNDLAQCTVTLNDNGQSFIENDSLTRWSAEYRNNGLSVLPIRLKAGGTINYTFNNASAVAIIVTIEQYFYNPVP